ncbi:MAG TPA: hypothetical protein VII43_07885 [Opitutaceae bacterium]
MARDEGDELRVTSAYMDAKLSPTHPGLVFLGVDSLGEGKVGHDVLAAETSGKVPYVVTRSAGDRASSATYSQASAPGTKWTVEGRAKSLTFESRASADGVPDPLVLTFDTHRCYATLLGLLDDRGGVALPAILHLPGFGTFRISGATGATVGYSSGPGWIKVALPAAAGAGDVAGYTWEVTTICPWDAGAAADPRLDGFRRNWLNILQLNPNRRLLSNNTSSDSCGFCYYEYADIARATPPLARGLFALDMVRQSLDSVLAGTKTYGMPGYGDFPEESSDTFPSLLIAADDYVEGRGDRAWLQASYPAIRAMAEKMLATDRSGDGLIKYVATGNSGSWNEGQPKVRPSNWWDTIGFGYEDAYANALAFRALGGMERLAQEAGSPGDARRYGSAAAKLHDAYFPTFFNPETGLVAGWRSADGQIHDYAFTFVNGIAVAYGLVPADKAAGIMDRLWDRMSHAGFNRFRMGLPGNLVPVARKDYAHKNPRYGGGIREDNADGFQVYENGGVTACFTYFAIAAFDRVGQHARADQILLPILDAFEKREFEGTGQNGMTNDWRKWDGTAEGYEGFLVDNYYVLLAAKEREDRLLGK